MIADYSISNNIQEGKNIEENTEFVNDLQEPIDIQQESVPEATQDDIKDHEELVRLVTETTKTLPLLDFFEGYSKSNSIKYERLVVENCKYRAFKGNHYVGFNLVIERGHNSDYVGDITFTSFKTGKDYELREYINSEISDSIIEEYVDRNEFFRFSKPDPSSNICMVNGCTMYRSRGYEYCSYHTCNKTGCHNQKKSGSVYCIKHAKP